MLRPHDTGGEGQPEEERLEAERIELAAAAIDPELRPLLETMLDQGIPIASGLEVIRLVSGVAVGSAWNGHTMAKLEGRSRAEARARPATSLHQAISDYLGGDTFKL